MYYQIVGSPLLRRDPRFLKCFRIHRSCKFHLKQGYLLLNHVIQLNAFGVKVLEAFQGLMCIITNFPATVIPQLHLHLVFLFKTSISLWGHN